MTNPTSTFCVMPWISINSTATGQARICCVATETPGGGGITNEDGVPFNLSTSTADDILKSSYLKSIRKSLLTGKEIPECKACLDKEKYSGSSRRTSAIKQFSNIITEDIAKATTSPDGTIQPVASFWHVRFGNLCNLKCIMCGPLDSSQWYNSFVSLTGLTTFHDLRKKITLTQSTSGRYVTGNEFNWWETDFFWKAIENNIPTITHLYFTGGEPLLIEPHYELLKKLIAYGRAPFVTLEYDTNLMAVKSSSKDIWKQFKQVNISVSIDDVSERNDYIRFPSNWGLIISNINKIKDWELPNIKMSYSLTWQILNSFTFLSVLDYLRDDSAMYVRVLQTPEWLNCRYLPDNVKQQLITKYETWIGDNPKFRKSILPLISLLNDDVHKQNNAFLKLFFNNIKTMDNINNTNWKVTFPELYSALNEYE